jgi:hypothetical protein
MNQLITGQDYQELKNKKCISFLLIISLFEKRIKRVEMLENDCDGMSISKDLKEIIGILLTQNIEIEHRCIKLKGCKSIDYVEIGVIISNFGKK